MAARTLVLHSCDCRFDLHCDNDHIGDLLTGVFGGLAAPLATPVVAHRAYQIHGSEISGYTVTSADGCVEIGGVSELLVHVDKSITIDLQHLRPDLLFIHGAVLARDDRAVIISAPPGTGKSTLTLVALQAGLQYSSDELAPVDLQTLTVHPYPRAPHLKAVPPAPQVMPEGAMQYGEGYYVAVAPSLTSRGPARLEALIFLRRDHDTFEGARRISAASGAAHLIANTLNLLAHPAVGLDAAASLSRAVACFELDATDLAGAAAAIRATLSQRRGLNAGR